MSKSPARVDKNLVEEFGEACKKALLKQFTENRGSKFELRMSNVGRPLCQLQMEAKGIKGEGQPYNAKVRNTFGDIIEALALFIMKSAGVEIKNEQKQVKYKFNGEEIEGRQDVEIDEKVWDIKSASPYSFERSLEKMVDLMKLLKMIPLAMRHKDFYMEKVKVKTSVVG